MVQYHRYFAVNKMLIIETKAASPFISKMSGFKITLRYIAEDITFFLGIKVQDYRERTFDAPVKHNRTPVQELWQKIKFRVTTE